MPYPVGLLDPECTSNYGSTFSATFPMTVGSSFQTGDLRIVYFALRGTPTASTFPGWTKNVESAGPLQGRLMVFTKVLTPGAVDGVLTVSFATDSYMYAAVTVRNPFLAQSITITNASATPASRTSASNPSVTATANGVLLNFALIGMSTTGTVFTADPSMTQLATAAADDGTAYYEALIAAENYVTAGSTGTKSHPISPTGSYEYQTSSLYLQQNPDVTFTMSTSPNETDAGVVTTSSIPNTQTHFTMSGSPNETDAAPQVFTQLTGFRISPLLAIPQSPITSSVIHWDQATPAVGSTVTVETSVDGGASWQPAVQDGPIARLLPGTSVWQTVQTRVTLKRLRVTDPSPRVSNVEVRVATNASNAELVSLGLFTINNTNITITGGTTGGSSGSGGGGNGVTGSGGGNTGGGLSIEISGVDLSRSVSRNSWEDVHFVDSGTNYATAIHDIIEDRLPGTQYNFASTTHVTPKLIFGMSMDSDPWQDAQDLATAIGMELYFDALGVCTLRDVPDPGTGQSVWTFSDSANPTIASATRSLTDQTVFNYIVAYGESVDNAVPVSAVAFDDNPNSPTYYLGAYGKVPTSFTSPEITTVEQAQAAADALLNLSIGNAENVEISVVPNPALEPGDVITVTIGELKLTGTFMVNDMNTPLSAAEAQTFTVYRQTT
ncbi:MAG: RoPhREQ1 [Nocardioides sp.]|nr:RoPhREQ1 [Nocardioides sp.]